MKHRSASSERKPWRILTERKFSIVLIERKLCRVYNVKIPWIILSEENPPMITRKKYYIKPLSVLLVK